MISQIINLSKNKSFKYYREKYQYSILLFHGLFGLEIRNIPTVLFKGLVEKRNPNTFTFNNDVLITGSIKEILNMVSSSGFKDELIAEALKTIKNFEKYETVKYQIGSRQFDFKFAYSMGILNVTPDSFSDGGKFFDKKMAFNHAMKMIDDGVDIIDVGGESTRPGSEQISEQAEMQRVLLVIKDIVEENPEVVISIDTTRANVAREALKSGALIVNDISGGTFQPEIFDVVKEFDAAIVIMHIKGEPSTMQNDPNYDNVITEVYNILARKSEKATNIGIKKIFIDPGIGFGKRTEDNLKLLDGLENFKSLGYPILIGVSRKSLIGNILNLRVEERDDATNALNAIAMTNGAKIIRNHNSRQAVETCKLYNSIISN